MKKKWESLDGWRGNYVPVPPAGWEVLLDCSVVNDTGPKLANILKAKLKKEGIGYRTGYLRTSNVFSSQFYVIIEQDKITPEIKKLIENWFVGYNNGTFSIFSGESWELNEEEARKDFERIFLTREIVNAN